MNYDEMKEQIIAHKSTNEPLTTVTNDFEARNLSFTIDGRGSDEGSLHDGLLCLNQKPMLVDNGQAFTSGIIPGIEDIWLESSESGAFYDYTIKVKGACPEGKWDNNLTFTDESGDAYTLRIYSTTPREHFVNYHSPGGNINKITWDI